MAPNRIAKCMRAFAPPPPPRLTNAVRSTQRRPFGEQSDVVPLSPWNNRPLHVRGRGCCVGNIPAAIWTLALHWRRGLFARHSCVWHSVSFPRVLA